MKLGCGVGYYYWSRETVYQAVSLLLKCCVSNFFHSFQVIYIKLATQESL